MGKNKKRANEVNSMGGTLLSTPVSISHEFEGLTGFEEISSCTLMKLNKYGRVKREIWKDGKIVKKKKQTNSKKNTEVGEESVPVGTVEEEGKKKKRKKKKKKKSSVPESSIQDTSSNTESQADNWENDQKGTESSQENINQNGEQIVKKTKKRKKKQPSGVEERSSKKNRYDCTSYQGNGGTERGKVDVSEWVDVFAPLPVQEALAELGFSHPTEIQKLVLPAAIKGRKDIIGAAETGSGKTLAFVIPIIHGILHDMQREALEDIVDSGEEDLDSDEEMQDIVSEEELENDDNSEEEEDQDSEEGDQNLGESIQMSDDDKNSEDSDEKEASALLAEDSDSNDTSEREDEGDMDTGNVENMEGIGCVKVIDNIKFDFLDEDKSTEKSKRKLRALIVTPTRELAIQVKSHLCAVLKYTKIKAVVIVGGVAQQKQERLLRSGPDIVVGTPGRLWELIQHNNNHLMQVPDVRYLAIDETDRMVERGHFQELAQLLELINSNEQAKEQRQTFVFSATLSTVHNAPKRLQMKRKAVKMTSEVKINQVAKLIGVKPNPKVVDVTRKFGTAESLTEARINCMKEEKDFYLYYFLKCYPGRTLVFCNSIDCVRRLQNLFTLLQCQPQSLHASLQQKQRLKSLERFSSNPQALLLATDVAARGLDIPNIEHVMHYQVPRTAETYIHRSGRTARATKEGLSILLIDSSEAKKYRQLCTTLNRATDLPPFPVNVNIMSQVKRRLSLARTLEKIEHTQRKTHAEKDWFRRAAEEAELLIDEDDCDTDEERENAMREKRERQEIQSKRAALAKMLASPLLTSNFSGKYPTHTGSLVMPFLTPGSGEGGSNEGKATGKALSVMKKESEEFSQLLKTVKIKVKAPVKKVNKKKFKGFEKRKKKIQKEEEEFLKGEAE